MQGIKRSWKKNITDQARAQAETITEREKEVVNGENIKKIEK